MKPSLSSLYGLPPPSILFEPGSSHWPFDCLNPGMTKPCDHSQQRTVTVEVFAAAYAVGLRRTVHFLLSKGANLDSAEEVAQTAWVRGWEARAQLTAGDRLQPWINTIAFHSFCLDRRRSNRHLPLTEVPGSNTVDTYMALDATTLLGRCTPFEKALLQSRYVDCLALQEIAAGTGLSEIAVRLRIHRCKRKLRSIVLGAGATSASSVRFRPN